MNILTVLHLYINFFIIIHRFCYSLTAMISGYFISKWGHIPLYVKCGSFFGCIGAFLITFIGIDTSYTTEFFIYMLYGSSVGVIYQNCVLIAQQVSPPDYLGISTTISSFFNYIGGVVGVGIYGAFLQNIYPSCYKKYFPEAQNITISNIHDIPMGDIVYVESIQKTYLYSIFPFSILIFFCALLIKDYKFNTNANKTTIDNNNCKEKIEEMKKSSDNIVVTVSVDQNI